MLGLVAGQKVLLCLARLVFVQVGPVKLRVVLLPLQVVLLLCLWQVVVSVVGAAAAVFGVVGGVFAGGGSEATGTHGRGAALATTGAMASGRGGLWVWGISFAGGAVLASGGVLIASAGLFIESAGSGV